MRRGLSAPLDPDGTPLGSRLVTNLGILGIGELLTRGLTFVAFAHLARTVAPEAFGQIEWALAVMMFCTLVVDQGFGFLGAREIARDPEVTAGFVDRAVSSQVVLAAAVFALLVAAALLLPLDPVLGTLLVGFGISLFGLPFFLIWVFQGRSEMLWVALPQVLRQAVFLAGVVWLVRGADQLTWLPLAEIAAVAAASLSCVVVYRLRVGRAPRVRLRVDREILREVLPIGGSQLIWALRMYLPIVLMLFLVGERETGLFGVAHRIVMVFQSLLGVYFTNLFPTISRASAVSDQRLWQLLKPSLHLVWWPTAAFAVGMAFASPWVLGVVFGSEFVTPSSIGSLVVLSCVIPVLGWRRHGRSALVALNMQRADFRCSLVGIVLLVVLLVPLARTYGPLGGSAAMLVSETVATLLTWLALWPRLRGGGQ